MNTKMAIVGMDTIFGIDEGLDEFDRTIFDGLQQAARLSPDRPKKIRAGTKSEYKEDCARILNEPAPPSALTLMRLVIDRTLQGTLSGSTERDWNDLALIVVSEAEVPGLEKGMSRFITETSVFNALQTARDLLFSEEVRGVMLGAVHCPPHGVDPGQVDKCTNCNGLSVGEGAGAVFLKRVDQADMDQDHIYAIIEAVVVEPHGLPQEKLRLSQQVDAMTKRAFSIAGVGPGEISYLEASGLGIEGTEQPEIEGLAQAYGSDKNGLTCALGNVKANIGEASVVTVLASIVKAALCAHHRYIPATPGWTGPENEGLWKDSPFYVAMESRPWFVNQAFPQRVAQVSSLVRGEVAEVILSEDIRQKSRPNLYLELVSPYCFPLLGDDRAELSDQLESLKRTVETSVSLKDEAAKSLATFQNGSEGAYALMIVGHGQEELLREIQFMMKGTRIPPS